MKCQGDKGLLSSQHMEFKEMLTTTEIQQKNHQTSPRPQWPRWAEHDAFSYCANLFLLARLTPHLLSAVKRQLKRMLVHPESRPYVEAWQKAASSGIKSLQETVLQKTDFWQAARSCSPLGFLWTPKERMLFFQRWWALRDDGVPPWERCPLMPSDGKQLKLNE